MGGGAGLEGVCGGWEGGCEGKEEEREEEGGEVHFGDDSKMEVCGGGLFLSEISKGLFVEIGEE